MAPDSTSRRRWISGIALGTALLMLVVGEAWLEARLSRLGFALYWLSCVLLTVIAIIAALLELRAVQRGTRREHKDLLDDTLRTIHERARENQRKGRN